MPKLDYEQVAKYAENIRKWMDEAIEDDVEQGLVWYEGARKFCYEMEHVFRVEPIKVATLVSLLSPQKKWEQNLEEVESFLNEYFHHIIPQKAYFASKKTLAECESVLAEGFEIPEHRTKTYSFADNIADENSVAVTIDRHAIKVANDDLTAQEISITAKRYREAAAAYNLVAVEQGLHAYQVQAITWVCYKRVVGR
jgi:hypothetical protein